MPVRARINPTWATKWTVVATALVLFGFWCIYDARVAYPLHNQKVAAFAHFQQERRNDPTLFDPAGNPVNWDYDSAALADLANFTSYGDYARSRSWSQTDPGKPRSHTDIFAQWVQLAIVWPLALSAFIWVLWNRRRPLVADEHHVLIPSGKKIPYDAINAIDKTRWNAKGIAIAHHEHEGRSGSFKIDDWIYRDADLVLEEIERRTGLVDSLPGD